MARSNRRALVVAIIVMGCFGGLLQMGGQVAAQQDATLEVTRLDDPVPDGCRLNGCSLREAIIEANNDADINRIALPTGTIVLSRTGAHEDQGLTGDLDVTHSVALQGTDYTVIDSAGIDRIFDLVSPPEHSNLLELNHLTMVHGRASASTGDSGDGGAVRSNGRLQLNYVNISDSTAEGSGGAVYVSGQFGFHQGLVENNHAGAMGGGFYTTGTPSIIGGSSLLSNSAAEGGAVWTESAQLFSIENVISHNTSDQAGGGLFLGNDVTADFAYDTIVDNSAGTDGGGFSGGARANIRFTTIADNQAERDGGGFYFGGVTVSVRSSTVSGNIASRGGALLTLGNLDAENTTISGNQATNTVGGVLAQGASASLKYLTIANNSAPNGGGLTADGGMASVTNTIIAASSGGTNCAGVIESMGHNLEDADTCSFDSNSDLTNANPLLGPLQDNGGRTWTHALLADSPAVDAGGTCQDIDQRELQRPSDGNADGHYECDIGSFELGTCYGTGDVNGDLHINSIDAILLLQLIAGSLEATACFPDIDLSGSVDARDSLLVLELHAGLLSTWPPRPS